MSRDIAISLLHATHENHLSYVELEARWRLTASYPARIEHIFAMDDSAKVSRKLTEGSRRVITRRSDALSTAVANWNAASVLASGDLLFVIADDLIPSKGWDEKISAGLTPADCQSVPFALKVADSDLENTDTLLRHPIISRAFYERNGLFNNEFRGVYCDDDLTLRAFFGAQILDRRNVVFRHSGGDNFSISKELMNRPDEYTFGKKVFTRNWGPLPKLFPTRNLAINTILLRSGFSVFSFRTLLVIRTFGRALRSALPRLWG